MKTMIQLFFNIERKEKTTPQNTLYTLGRGEDELHSIFWGNLSLSFYLGIIRINLFYLKALPNGLAPQDIVQCNLNLFIGSK